MNEQKLTSISKLLRYYILVSTTAAGSGHVSSSLSAVELMATLFFNFYRYDLHNINNVANDRLLFSKGHASPLLYALYATIGIVSEGDLLKLRTFDSPLEGHPPMRFPYAEAATGSLGQGLSIGVGLALNAKYLDKLSYRTFVLLGDSEMAEGANWEALQLAKYYKLDNLVGILDVNRLGQRGETMYGHNLNEYEKRLLAFGWQTIVIDGHDFNEIAASYEKALAAKNSPVMVIAKTIKGKGVSFLQDQDGWHGKALKPEEEEKALDELGEVEKSERGDLALPQDTRDKKQTNPNSQTPIPNKAQSSNIQYEKDKPVSTRKAHGNALARIFPQFPDMVVLDAEVSNSTHSEMFKEKHPERFFEMFIAEQNMVGAALGFSRRGKIPFVSTFAAFWTRAFDQIRMSQYSDANIKFVGSHAGVSIGEDGASQMGLEDIAMFRAILDSVVLYPSDAVSTERLVEEVAKHKGIVYIRTTRGATPVIYGSISPSPRPSPQRVEG